MSVVPLQFLLPVRIFGGGGQPASWGGLHASVQCGAHVLLPWHKLTGICSQVGFLQGVIAVIPGVSVANSPLFCS